MSQATIQYQVIWNRLISVVEEQAQALIRTAFGTATREAGDLSAGVFLPDGRMVAQAVTGTPGHVNSMAESVKHFLRVFPIDTLAPGDVLLTNDPWKGTGHLYDITMVTPVFHLDRPVALFASTLHVIDIGGLGPGPDGQQIWHEGLFLPIIKFIHAGELDQTVLNIVKANVREPAQVEGDFLALVACNDVGARRLLSLLDEFALPDLAEVGEYILQRSEEAMLEAVRRWPTGSWESELWVDGYDQPLRLQARLTLSHSGIHVDFAGSAGFVAKGINVVKAYTDAYTSFGIRCLIGADIPNNAGSLGVITIDAPEGSILNAPYPAAVTSRHIIGQMLPDVVFNCLRQARPGEVPAEGASCLWNIQLSGGHILPEYDAKNTLTQPRFSITSFSTGGTGARPHLDGLSTTSFPSGVRNVSLEILESISPVVFWRKEYRQDSGGAGTQRGGLGQVIELSHGQDLPMELGAAWDRIHFPAQGAEGGLAGAPGRVTLSTGETLSGKGRQVIPPGSHLIVETPGGGGLGDPQQRVAAQISRDVANQLIGTKVAVELYGHDAHLTDKTE
ncbi:MULTISPECIES: hydantoinase B/oxoprolinase family protein [unclassified Pantoea]|uniref:hydantoinase B/oxoprolinase family protein n=1 Tax=unclassified Pantoea TaxID=2630326 RepID=UPI001CD38DA9|nr:MULTISPECIES: hydantoinase B/oxoprolinase family protein [unclassified Pantoea]MCA1179716.1 hydantoinase B/oxoprolinase family protein [Pantoea sp. alder69]MCA1252311.1 hydantoinase B/oxoprolinase family protein [Pantoea sp. alder70]MCA1268059.1 hydantoinase B/oxoprolinase family protein [Pantoea sp. alder81]